MNINKNNLYVSVGNTRTSFAYFPENINSMKVIKKNTKLFLEDVNLDEILNEFNINPSKVFVCSVVQEVSDKLDILFKDKELIFLEYNNQNIISLDSLDNPKEIGNDIIASSIYANSLGTNIIVISLGTASVISSIDNGSLVGCIIMPGLDISYNALVDNTAIKKSKLIEINKTLGTNTQESLSIGIINGHKIMIESLATNLHTPKTKYIYFGGNSSYITFTD
jgi:type III pantothenate kinase